MTPGDTRPSQVFELTSEVEQLLSQAYVPLLSQFVRVFTQGLSAKRVNDLMRQAGKSLAEELLAGKRPSGNLHARGTFVSQLMNEQLGAVTHVEGNGKLVIRGAGCPIAALTGKHPGSVWRWKVLCRKAWAALRASAAIDPVVLVVVSRFASRKT